MNYLLDRIAAAEILSDPFPHLHIENFLSAEDFAAVQGAAEVTLPPADNIDGLFAELNAAGYGPIQFPGCTKNRAEYTAWLESGTAVTNTHSTCAAKGMALRCAPRSKPVRALDEFFRSGALKALLEDKFGITEPTRIEAGLQKYLHGYEISPHPDIRKKALTWMLNVNPGTDQQDFHTHYMRFRPEWQFVQDFWRDNPDVETCWVPWDWCDTVKRQTANNSIVIFAPRYDTLHAVRAHYGHLAAQRTQFYGNLWHLNSSTSHRPEWRDYAEGTYL